MPPMTDHASIQRQAAAARAYEQPIDDAPGVVFELRLPTRLDVKIAAVRANAHAAAGDPAAGLLIERHLLLAAITGWRGVCIGHLLPGAADAAQPYEHAPGAAVATLLDAQPDWADILGAGLIGRMAERRAEQDTAAKNSAVSSPGSDPAARQTH